MVDFKLGKFLIDNLEVLDCTFEIFTKIFIMLGIVETSEEIVLWITGGHPLTLSFFDIDVAVLHHASNCVNSPKLIIQTDVFWKTSGVKR